MNSSVIIIYNPAARRASVSEIDAARSFLASRGYTPEVLYTGKSGDAETFARQAARQNAHLIIAAGGDGTINEVMNGMAFSEVPLAVIPLGTTNVLAREIYRDRRLDAVLERIVNGQPRHVSLGLITCNAAGIRLSRYFSLMAGIGFDGQTVRNVSLRLKKRTGPGAYVLSGLRALLSYAPEELSLSIDGREVQGYAAIVGNISRYGGDFKITPDARIDDPSLYVCVFQGKKRSDLLRYVFMMLFGRHIRARDVLYLRAEEITIGGSSAIQIDGDYLGTTPATITVARDVIRLIC